MCIVDTYEKVTLFSTEELRKMCENYIQPNINNYITSDIVIQSFYLV
jgi:hypothetical protein